MGNGDWGTGKREWGMVPMVMLEGKFSGITPESIFAFIADRS